MVKGLDAFSLKGKTAIVSGGSAGIGLGIATQFAAAGAQVLATGRRQGGQAILSDAAPGAVYCQEDMTAPGSAGRIVAAACAAFGSVDILVNNAGYFENRTVEQYSPDYLSGLCAINVNAPLLLVQAFVEHRREQGGGGRIINISSVEGISTTMSGGMGAYGATKAALRGMTVSLARELGPEGIRVNAIAPGAIEHENMYALAELGGYGRDAVAQGLSISRERTSVERLGTPEDIAWACLYLASRAGDYVNGQTIVVDGGLSTKGC